MIGERRHHKHFARTRLGRHGRHHDAVSALNAIAGGDASSVKLSSQEALDEELEECLSTAEADVEFTFWAWKVDACALPTSEEDHRHLPISDQLLSRGGQVSSLVISQASLINNLFLADWVKLSVIIWRALRIDYQSLVDLVQFLDIELTALLDEKVLLLLIQRFVAIKDVTLVSVFEPLPQSRGILSEIKLRCSCGALSQAISHSPNKFYPI